MAKKRRRKNIYGSLGDTALGLGRLGVTLPVSAAVAARGVAMAPAAAPIMGGFGQIAQAAPTATLISVGGGLIGSLKKLNKPKKRRRK